MTPETLTQLAAASETLAVEFKGEERKALSDGALVETVACLANRPGSDPGWLLVGVEDDGRITGARPRHGERTDPYRVQALIAHRTQPALTTRVEVVTVDERPVIVVEVPRARTPTGTTDGKYLRRAIGGDGRPACLPFHFHQMQSWQADRGLLDYSALPMPDLSWDDLERLEFDRFRRTIRESGGLGDPTLLELPDLELAKALGAVEANHEVRTVRVLGLLLFGRPEVIREAMPTHEVAFQVLKDLRVEVNDFFRWPLLRIVDQIMTRFRARYREEELMIGYQRVGIPDYPDRAFKEGVANALIHRDYGRLGAIHVQWHEDRIEISSPGGFPEGVGLHNLLVTAPVARNPLLADAFKRAGVVERTARGIDTIFREQLRTGRRAPSYDRSTAANVVLDLPGGEADLDLARLVAEEGIADRPLDVEELLLLSRLWREGRLGLPEAARLIQKPEPVAREEFGRLAQRGLLEVSGEPRDTVFRLRTEPRPRPAARVVPVSKREETVLRYVETHGRVTRREVVDLCGIGGQQATRLLRALVAGGKLTQQGTGKGSWYGPRS